MYSRGTLGQDFLIRPEGAELRFRPCSFSFAYFFRVTLNMQDQLESALALCEMFVS